MIKAGLTSLTFLEESSARLGLLLKHLQVLVGLFRGLGALAVLVDA